MLTLKAIGLVALGLVVVVGICALFWTFPVVGMAVAGLAAICIAVAQVRGELKKGAGHG